MPFPHRPKHRNALASQVDMTATMAGIAIAQYMDIPPMPPDIVEQKKVTFASSLPLGTRATFTHDGELWIAYPAEKNQRLFAITDLLIGIHQGITNEMVRWINERPQDADLVTRVLERSTWAQKLTDELIIEKAEARVM